MATIGQDTVIKRMRESAVEETNGSVKAGLLMIMTPGTLMNSYQKRWFVIVESQLNHELIFHTSETKADNKGRLNLDEVIEIRRDPIGKVSKSFSKGPDEELRLVRFFFRHCHQSFSELRSSPAGSKPEASPSDSSF